MQYSKMNDLDLAHKTVILRGDLNVPIQNGAVSDFTRIDRLKPTIDYLRAQKARIVVMSHFGRPKNGVDPAFSLSFLPSVLSSRWDAPVSFASDCIGAEAEEAVKALQDGEIVLLENLRFHSGEEKNNSAFAQSLAKLGDVYINDAFSASHRAHASIAAITEYLPFGAGLLIQEELDNLHMLLGTPVRPMAAVVGGAKISTKLSLLNNLVKKVDYLILGGGMANTFLLAKGIPVGKSLVEPDMLAETNQIIASAKDNDCQIILPIDVSCAAEFAANAPHSIHPAAVIPDDLMVLDVGPESIENVKEILQDCKTIIWNGPMGAFEIQPFDIGTNALAKYVAEKTKQGALKSVAGGGDTVAALDGTNSSKDFTYISTAGGAFLEWLEGKTLPGIAALMIDKKAA